MVIILMNNVALLIQKKLAETVLETGSDFGLAFDGDGDRIIAVDENGQIVDGDQIMFIIGQEMYKTKNSMEI